jgi:hypothetical protein
MGRRLTGRRRGDGGGEGREGEGEWLVRFAEMRKIEALRKKVRKKCSWTIGGPSEDCYI